MVPSMIDLSLPIHEDMLHGGRRPSRETRADGGTRWLLSAHAGTHVEAPLHTAPGGAPIETLALDLLVGPARVLDLTGVETEITPDDLFAAGLADDPRVLLRTANSTGVLRERDKAEAWIGLAPDAAQLLVDRGVRLLGVDYLTVESPAREATFDAHYVLNRAGVAMIESVDLSGVEAGIVDLVCLPLPLAGAEAAPARVVLAPIGDGPLVDLTAAIGEDVAERIVVESFENGNACNVTRWWLGERTGTHVAAPETIEALALDALNGPVVVLDADDLDAAQPGARVLVRGAVDADALAALDAALVGVEGPAPALAIPTLGGLALDGVAPGAYLLTALPIPLRGAAAAPARVFLS